MVGATLLVHWTVRATHVAQLQRQHVRQHRRQRTERGRADAVRAVDDQRLARPGGACAGRGLSPRASVGGIKMHHNRSASNTLPAGALWTPSEVATIWW